MSSRRLLLLLFAPLLLLSCEKALSQAAATVDYDLVDLLAKGVYGRVVDSLHQDSFTHQVSAGMSTNPKKYDEVVLSNVSDGNYSIGGQVYHNVLATVKHAPKIQANLAAFEKSYHSMSDVFRSVGASTADSVSLSDIKLYYRFSADFLAMGGFAGDMDDLLAKYAFEDFVKVMRTGIFITQLPAIKGAKVGQTFALGDASGNSGDGVGAAGATYGATTAQVTGRTSMGKRDPNQCGLSYTADEQVESPTTKKSYPIAGVDGHTFGSTQDGVKSNVCGKCATVGGKQFIIADRVWQNDGAGGSTYNDKGSADKKSSSSGSGYTQIDIAGSEFTGNATKNIQIGDCR